MAKKPLEFNKIATKFKTSALNISSRSTFFCNLFSGTDLVYISVNNRIREI